MELWSVQINNLELFKSYRQLLRDFKSAHGEYPHYLMELPAGWRVQANGVPAVDYWGYPLYFETRNDSYILISFGRDGKPDRLDYWGLRDGMEPTRSGVTICYDWDADQVVSDRGFHKACGK